ncbi:MAG: ATP-binding protein [Bacteroidales bacterium]|nr:ATP-binding protein [Bacteroidales bacterium]
MNLKHFFLFLILLLLLFTGLLLYFTLQQGAVAFYIAEGAVIISVITLAVFYKRIVKPIRTLAQGMDMLKMQDFTQRLKTIGQKETDTIAETFNAIISRLREEQIHTREQEHFLNLIINNTSTAIILLDGNNKISFLNSAATTLFGKDVVSKGLSEINTPVAKILSSVAPHSTITLPTNTGDLFRCTHETFMDSGYAHHFFIIENVTTEINNAQRTAYEKIIRMISHEVNNSMTGILSTMQMLEEICHENNKLSYFEEPIDACINRSTQLGQFLSRIAQVVKIPDPKLRSCNINDCITQAVTFVKSEADNRNIDISIHYSAESIIKGIDIDLFQQALINILRNAMESIDKNGKISIDFSENHIFITDNGKGIDAKIAENIFRPFFSTKKGGQGIGLMMIADILTKHGFKYSLATNPQTNLTTFAIYI